MRKAKYKLYWQGVNWWIADNDKCWNADVRHNNSMLEKERMRNNIRKWMLKNPCTYHGWGWNEKA